jgi:hypothetical protein
MATLQLNPKLNQRLAIPPEATIFLESDPETLHIESQTLPKARSAPSPQTAYPHRKAL